MKNLVCIFAHPDDEFAAAGLLKRAKHHGYKTHLVCATNGEAGRIKGQHYLGDPLEPLFSIRRREFLRSCDILDLDGYHFLNLEDNKATSWNAFEAIFQLKSILLEIGPSLIVTFDKDGGNNHPDHQTVHTLTVRAFEELSSLGTTAASQLYFVSKLPREYITKQKLVDLPTPLLEKVTLEEKEPLKIIHLTDEELNHKKIVIENYSSQFPDEHGLYYKMPLSLLLKLSRFEAFIEYSRSNSLIVKKVSML